MTLNLKILTFLPNEIFSLILRIVSVSQTTIRFKFKLKELVPKFAFMTDIIPEVEIVGFILLEVFGGLSLVHLLIQLLIEC